MKTNKQKIGAKRSGIIAAVALLVTVMMVFSVLPGAFNEASGDLKEFTVSGSQDLGITPENAQPQLIQQGGPSQVMKFTAVGDYTITSYKKTVGGEISEQLWFEDGEWKLEGDKLKFTNEDDLTIIATDSSLKEPDDNGQIGKIFAISVYFNAVTADSSLYFYSTIQEYDVTLGEHVNGTLGEEEKTGPTNFPMNLDQQVVVHFDEYYVLDDSTGMEQVGQPEEKEDGLYYTFKVDKNWEPSPDAPDAKRQITAVRMYDVILKDHVFGDLDGDDKTGEVEFKMKSYQKLIVHFEKGYTLDESIGMKQMEEPFVKEGVEYYTFMVDENWTAPEDNQNAKREISAVQVFDVTLDRNVIGKLGNEVIHGYKNIKMKAGEEIVITFNEGYVLGDAVGMTPVPNDDGALIYKVDDEKNNHVISALKAYIVDIGEGVTYGFYYDNPSGWVIKTTEKSTSVTATLRSSFKVYLEEGYESQYGGMRQFGSGNDGGDSYDYFVVDPKADTHWLAVAEIEKPVKVFVGEGVKSVTVDGEDALIKSDDSGRYFEILPGRSFGPTFASDSEVPQKYDPENSKGIVPNEDGTFSLDSEADEYLFETQNQTLYTITVGGQGIGAWNPAKGETKDDATFGEFKVYEAQYLLLEVTRGHEVYTNPGITVVETEKETRYYANPDEPNHVILGTPLESAVLEFDDKVLEVWIGPKDGGTHLNPGDPVYDGEKLNVAFKDNLTRKHAVKSLTGLEDLSGKDSQHQSPKIPVNLGEEREPSEEREYLVLAGYDVCRIETAPLYIITCSIENVIVSETEAFEGTEITFQTVSKLYVLENVDVYGTKANDYNEPIDWTVQDEVYTFTMIDRDAMIAGDSNIRTMYFAAIQTSKTIKDVSINGQPTWNISVFNASFGIWLYPGENQVTYTLETGYTGTAQLYCMEFFTGKYTMLPGNVFDPTEIDSVLMDIPAVIPEDFSSNVKVVFLTLAVTDAAPVQTYEVSFDANGGEGMMDPVKVEAGEFVLPDCAFEAPEGAEFAGWSLTMYGDVVEKIDVVGNVTVYATWKDAVEPQPPVPEFSENVLVSIKSTGDGNVYVLLNALDGRPIPGGKITVYLNYSVYNEKIDDYVDRSDPVTVDVKESQNASEILLVTVTGAPNYSLASSVVAEFAVGDTDYRSDVVQFAPVTAGPEEIVKPEE